jgi:hypothetical protein
VDERSIEEELRKLKERMDAAEARAADELKRRQVLMLGDSLQTAGCSSSSWCHCGNYG